MQVITKTLPAYTVQSEGDGIFDAWIKADSKVAVLGGHTALSLTREVLKQYLMTQDLAVFWTGGECNQSNHDRLIAECSVLACDWIIGVGGGRALDMAKWVAETLRKPILCIPTIASTCAACSAVSVVYDDKHQFVRIHELQNAPRHIILIPSILAEAPVHFLHAGIGDAISKPVEINFSGKHQAWSYPNFLGKSIAEATLSILLEQGEAAYQANQNRCVNASFINVVSAIIMGVGYASILVDEDYNSALAHALYNAFMNLDSVKRYAHGLVVAYGVLVQCLVDEDQTGFERLYPFYKRLSLPISLCDIGTTIDDPELVGVVEAALMMPDCQYVSKQLTLDIVLEAMRSLETIKSQEVI